MKTKLKKPDLVSQCMNCSHYNGQHELTPKVVCEWKPMNADMHFRNVNPDFTVDCPKLKWGLNWK